MAPHQPRLPGPAHGRNRARRTDKGQVPAECPLSPGPSPQLAHASDTQALTSVHVPSPTRAIAITIPANIHRVLTASQAGSAPSTFHPLFLRTLKMAPGGGCHFNPHFTDEATETGRASDVCQAAQQVRGEGKIVKPGGQSPEPEVLTPKLSASRACLWV